MAQYKKIESIVDAEQVLISAATITATILGIVYDVYRDVNGYYIEVAASDPPPVEFSLKAKAVNTDWILKDDLDNNTVMTNADFVANYVLV